MGKDAVPSSWTSCVLADVTQVNPTLDKSLFSDDLAVAFVPMPAVEAESGVIDVSELKTFKEVKKGYTPFKAGDVLFAKITPCMENGKMGVVPYLENGLGFGSTEFHVLRCLDGISPQYVYYFVSSQSFRADAERNMTGAVGQRRVPTKWLGATQIPLAPETEQQRIVAKIEELFSELDKGVESLKTARQQLDVYRQSFLKNAVEGKLTEQWRKDNENHLSTVESVLETIKQRADARRHEQLKAWEAQVAKWESTGKLGTKPRKPPAPKPLPDINQDELDLLPTLPSTWKYQRLADVAQIGSGMSVSKGRKLENPVEVPYLRVANVQRGAVVLDEIKTMPVEESKLGDLLLEKWDVLFNEGGDRDKLGRGWVWESQIEKCITQNHVFRATTYLGGEEHSKFISHWGNSHGQAYFEQGAKQVVNLASINKTVLSMFPVPVPPLPEQKAIIQQLEVGMSSLDLIEADIDQGLRRSEGLRQSILKQAFAGQLVPQNPNDESAAILLERIKKEREESEALAKKAKAAARKEPNREAKQ